MKTFFKWLFRALGIIILIILISFLFPYVADPNPSYQNELEYGEALSPEIQEILTPAKEPERTRSIMVLKDEKVVFEYGPTDKIINGHSTRKAFLGLLYGIAIQQGLIDTTKTLKELGIDENTPLTELEKSATIRDLMMWRSGIYLPAAGEHDAQITDRPKRGSHQPGEYFFANNFDSNALGSIFIQETGYSIGEFMEEYLAKPLGMQDFDRNNVKMGPPWFFPEKDSRHKMYYMFLSTRDFARIGALVANNGKWRGQQIVPEEWIKESTHSHSSLKGNHITYGRYDAFGYLWWIDEDTNTIWTDGYGGQFMLIDPENKLTLVERNFTGNSHLTSGLWLMNRNMDHSLFNLIKAHEMMVSNLDSE